MNNNNNNNSTSSRNGNTTSQACAACKHQRRKCGPNCILAPYFPHDRQKQFLNAHKLFGVGRISSMIKPLSPSERNMAMETIIFQADMRAYDPVGGCYRLIQQLQSQIEHYKAELQLVLQHLAIFRAQAQQAQAQQNLYDPTTTYANVNLDDADPLTLYNSANVNVSDNNMPQYLQQFQQNQYEATANINSNGTSMHEDLNSWIVQNSMSLSPLAGNNENENARVGNNDYVFDQKPVLDLGIKELNSDTKH